MHGFREVSSFPDEAAIKRAFKSALTLQPKQVSAVNQDVRWGVAASSYSAHFLEGAALKASQASSLLTSLLNSVNSTSRSDLEAQLRLALSSVEDTKSFLSHGQAAQSDALGSLTAIDVNLTVASRDRFSTRLLLYLPPWHRAILRYSDFMSESLMPALQEVIVASREDATHESTRQVANLGLSQGRRPSSHGPPRAGGRSAVPHGDVAPVRRATVLLGTKIFPVGENLATPETVPMGTATLDTAAVTDVEAPPETLHPDDFPMEAGSLRGPLPGLPSSDVLSCADQRPVCVCGGGCLWSYRQAWQEITSDQWVLDIIANGYGPEFSGSRPPLSREWRHLESASPTTMLTLQQEVDLLLAKEAIERVRHPESLGFYSRVFLLPKKNGKLRPVINLRPLNQCILCPHFQMETVASISSAVRPGDWATSLDLTDAYFHVPNAPWFRKYLRFVVNGQIWHAVPGAPVRPVNSSPSCTRLLSPLSIHLHARDVLFHRYLDDLLIRAPSRSLCRSWTQAVLSLLYRLGLGVNREKSEAVPSQDFVYVYGSQLSDSERDFPPPL